MKFEIYKESKHGEMIQDKLFNDKAGAELLGKIGINSIEESCTFWSLKLVLMSNDFYVGHIFCGSSDGVDRFVYIEEVYIDKNFRGKGSAKILIDEVIKYYKKLGLQEIRLKVYAHNEKAIKLYESIGFEDMGTHRNASKIGDIKFYHLNLEKK